MLLVANRQTDRQTNKPTDKGENIIFAVVEVKKHLKIIIRVNGNWNISQLITTNPCVQYFRDCTVLVISPVITVPKMRPWNEVLISEPLLLTSINFNSSVDK